jgi:hypothetical protein
LCLSEDIRERDEEEERKEKKIGKFPPSAHVEIYSFLIGIAFIVCPVAGILSHKKMLFLAIIQIS